MKRFKIYKFVGMRWDYVGIVEANSVREAIRIWQSQNSADALASLKAVQKVA